MILNLEINQLINLKMILNLKVRLISATLNDHRSPHEISQLIHFQIFKLDHFQIGSFSNFQIGSFSN
jgi:hypothetical protein